MTTDERINNLLNKLIFYNSKIENLKKNIIKETNLVDLLDYATIYAHLKLKKSRVENKLRKCVSLISITESGLERIKSITEIVDILNI